MTVKERAVKIISRLPDDSTVHDIMEKLYLQLKVETGLRQSAEGKVIPHAAVKKRVR